jgi:hypothetical protein
LAGARARPFYDVKVWDSRFNDIFSKKGIFNKHILVIITSGSSSLEDYAFSCIFCGETFQGIFSPTMDSKYRRKA